MNELKINSHLPFEWAESKKVQKRDKEVMEDYR
jgi:hypothetical protein